MSAELKPGNLVTVGGDPVEGRVVSVHDDGAAVAITVPEFRVGRRVLWRVEPDYIERRAK